jgi:O-antigen/teichoic acid export membrane protein
LSAPFALYALVTPIFLQIDIFMLSRMSSYESVGIYSAAFKVFLSFIVIPNALRAALFPSLSRLFSENKEKHIETFEVVCKFVILIVLPISFGIFFLSDNIIYLLYTNAFAESVWPLKILAVMMQFYFLRSVCAVTLYSSYFEYKFISMLLSALALNILLNLFLIPKWDAVGASIASLISEMAVFAGSYLVILAKLFKTKNMMHFIKIVFSILFICLFIVLSAKLPTLSQIGFSFVIYLFWLATFKAFRPYAFSKFKQILSS